MGTVSIQRVGRVATYKARPGLLFVIEALEDVHHAAAQEALLVVQGLHRADAVGVVAVEIDLDGPLQALLQRPLLQHVNDT